MWFEMFECGHCGEFSRHALGHWCRESSWACRPLPYYEAGPLLRAWDWVKATIGEVW